MLMYIHRGGLLPSSVALPPKSLSASLLALYESLGRQPRERDWHLGTGMSDQRASGKSSVMPKAAESES
jgi:hypothetical protein